MATLYVTNLNASGAGSLRAAVEASGERTVHFSVGGMILDTNELVVTNPYLTIAGETAPVPGITLAKAGIRVRTHDVEIRHIRVRVGDQAAGPPATSRDGIRISPGTGYEAYNVLIDHCSVSWAVDENMSAWWGADVHDCQITNCIISECLYDSIHPEGIHSCGLLIGDDVENIEITGNLFAHNWIRNPYLKGGTVSAVVNNVVYNAELAIHLQDPDSYGPHKASIVGNVLLAGPDYATPRIRIYNTCKEGTEVYADDNVAPLPIQIDTGFDPLVDSPPWWPAGLTAKASGDVLDWVLGNAGARPDDRDAIDLRIVEEVGTAAGNWIDSQDDVGGWVPRAVRSIETWREFVEGSNLAIRIETHDGRSAEIAHPALPATEAGIKAEIEDQIEGEMGFLYYHLNDDDTVAVASGAAPAVWPEDM